MHLSPLHCCCCWSRKTFSRQLFTAFFLSFFLECRLLLLLMGASNIILTQGKRVSKVFHFHSWLFDMQLITLLLFLSKRHHVIARTCHILRSFSYLAEKKIGGAWCIDSLLPRETNVSHSDSEESRPDADAREQGNFISICDTLVTCTVLYNVYSRVTRVQFSLRASRDSDD